MKNKIIHNKKFIKGFTLLELLVVVLIIGILAAIALPQYQMAVERSKASQAIVLIKAIYESVKSYHLTTGHYPTDFSQLDISIPEEFDINEKFINNENTYGKSNKDWNISIQRYDDESVVVLYIIHVRGKYKGAGFRVGYEGSGLIKFDKILCIERFSGANYIFDSTLPQGAYCEKIMKGTFYYENQYARVYELN